MNHAPDNSPVVEPVQTGKSLRDRYWLAVSAAVVLAITLCVGIIIVVGKAVKLSVIYGVTAQFEVYPADDRELLSWMEKQPGMIRVYGTRKPDAVHMVWIMSQDLFGSPPVPEFERAFERLGYQGQKRLERN